MKAATIKPKRIALIAHDIKGYASMGKIWHVSTLQRHTLYATGTT